MRQLDIFGKIVETPDEEVKEDRLVARRQRLQNDTPVDTHIANQSAEAEPARSDVITTQDIGKAEKSPSVELKSSTELSQSPPDDDHESRIKEAKARIRQQLQKELARAKRKAEELEIKPAQKRGRKSLKEQPAESEVIEVPDDELLFQKQYYSISEVAGWFRVNVSVIRFWENEFDVLKPKKTGKGNRLFRPEDVKNLQLIYHLVREKKYTLEGAKEYIKTNKERVQMQVQLTQALQKFKGFLLELKANLQA